MRKNSYFKENEKEKEEYNIHKGFSAELISKKLSEDFIEDEINDNRYNESESSREDDLPIKEGLFNETPRVIKGISLAFVYFSVIIYSLLYMLTPEKSANLIFIGNYDTSLFNYTFYKLDDIKIKENLIILNISLNNIIKDNITNNNNYLRIYINLEEKKINKVYINNGIRNKDIYLNKNDVIYNDYKINDFPFWLCLFNKENFDMRNITSEFLIDYFDI